MQSAVSKPVAILILKDIRAPMLLPDGDGNPRVFDSEADAVRWMQNIPAFSARPHRIVELPDEPNRPA